ncbi:MAG: hypothetical protein ABSD20_01230 [Terriglobales bacterium]|jgi:hypothetical protein
MNCKALVLVCLLILATSVFAQTTPATKYDSTTETTMKGVVEDVREVPGSCQGHACVYLTLKTDNGTVEVQVAPPNFLKEMEFSFAKGDHLEVIGSKVDANGAPLVLARTITRGTDELVVRNDDGRPLRSWFK